MPFGVLASNNRIGITKNNTTDIVVTPTTGTSTIANYALFFSTSLGTISNSNCISSCAISLYAKTIIYLKGLPRTSAQQVFINDGNFGTTFTNITSQLFNFPTDGGCRGVGVSDDGTIIVVPVMTTLLSNYNQIFVSTNSGISFTPYSCNGGSANITSYGIADIHFSSDNNYCWINTHDTGGTGDSFRNTTGNNFTNWTTNTSSSTKQASMCLVPTGSISYWGSWFGYSGMYKSANFGTSFTSIYGTTYSFASLACNYNGTIIYGLTAYGPTASTNDPIIKSTDSGATWTTLSSPATGVWNSIVCDSTGQKVVILYSGSVNLTYSYNGNGVNTSTNALYYSGDGGTTWTGYKGPTNYPLTVYTQIQADRNFTSFIINSNYGPNFTASGYGGACGYGDIFVYKNVSATGTFTSSTYGVYTLYMFTAGTGTITFSSTATVYVLLVGGGGGGAYSSAGIVHCGGGGGGGGGVGYGTINFVAGTTYTITVGVGGGPDYYNNGFSGLDTTIVGTDVYELAYGGGGGSAAAGSKSGGSGGGTAGGQDTGQSGGITTKGSSSTTITHSMNYYGNAGGSVGSYSLGGSGGGGAGNPGDSVMGNVPGNGGAGIQWPINTQYYGGGGGGGAGGDTIGLNGSTGGLGGGGAGGKTTTDPAGGTGLGTGTNGTANTGGGGGGGGYKSNYGGSGGSGVVIFAF